jgi:hypothetical protein
MVNGMRTPSRTAVVLSCLLLAGVTGAFGSADDAGRSAVARIRWSEVALPSPIAGAVRVTVRDAVGCGDRWYVVGGATGADDVDHPAAWESPDGRAWRSVPFAPLPAGLYGAQSTIYSVACSGRGVAMIGAKTGGVHANPRISTWYLNAGGAMTEVAVAFETYGGPDAIDVARVAAGPSGFVIAGNRTSGAAVWLSADATGFRLVAGAPGLAGSDGLTTSISDAAVTGSGLTVVGGIRRAGRIDSDPAVWTSPDGGTWTRADLPGGRDDEVLQRVVRSGDELVSVGVRGSSFGSWRAAGGTWQATGTFGGTAARGVAEVDSVTTAGRWLVVSADDGAGYGLWLSSDGGRSWRAGALPAGQGSGGDRSMVVAGMGTRVLLTVDDAVHARVWIADRR